MYGEMADRACQRKGSVGICRLFREAVYNAIGRGIEKICEACKKYGVAIPEYTLHLEDIMVKFTPLVQSKVPEKSDDTLDGTLSGALEEKMPAVREALTAGAG